MRNPLLVLIGLVAAGFGLVFAGQGIGVITQIQSNMVNSPAWAVIGSIMALFGIGCMIAGFRSRSEYDEDL